MGVPGRWGKREVTGFTCPAEDIAAGCQGPKDCFYADPDSCNNLIQCDKTGKADRISCPPDTEWDDNEKDCVPGYSPTCGDIITEVVDVVKGLLPPPNAQVDKGFDCAEAKARQGCEKPKGLSLTNICVYANPGDEHTFIECQSGVPYVSLCQEGTVYNDAVKACDYPR